MEWQPFLVFTSSVARSLPPSMHKIDSPTKKVMKKKKKKRNTNNLEKRREKKLSTNGGGGGGGANDARDSIGA